MNGEQKEHKNQIEHQNYLTWRRFFIKLLGSKCVACGWTEDLEIDHIYDCGKGSGRGQDNRRRDWAEQYFKKNLQLLCHNCHTKKTHGEPLEIKYSPSQ